MTPRRRAREFVLQGIYQWLYTGNPPAQVLKNLSEMDHFAEADRAFLESELAGAIGDEPALRARLEPLADRKWDEVSPVERAILLLAAWELVHSPEIPYQRDDQRGDRAGQALRRHRRAQVRERRARQAGRRRAPRRGRKETRAAP